MTWLIGRLPGRMFKWRGYEFWEKESSRPSVRFWAAELEPGLRLELVRNEKGEDVIWEAYACVPHAVLLEATTTQVGGNDAKAAGYAALDRLYDSLHRHYGGIFLRERVRSISAG